MPHAAVSDFPPPADAPVPPHRSPISIGGLAIVYLCLMVLLASTVIAALFPLGAIGLVIALSIAAVKSILVILYFMHVRFSSRVTWLFVTAGFLWLSIMFSLTFSEYLGRSGLTRAQPLSTEYLHTPHQGPAPHQD